MTLQELLALYANPEATDEQKAEAVAAYEAANKPAEIDTTEIDALKESIAKLEGKNKELLSEKQQAKQLAEEAARKNMSTEELKQDYERRLNEALTGKDTEWNGKYEAVLNQLKTDKVEGQALKLAAALSDYPDAILPHIQSRIGFEVGESGFDVFVKGSDGKRTAATFDELQKELASAAHLKPLLKPDFKVNGDKTTKTVPADDKKAVNPVLAAYKANLIP